jgi:hypothetical protein
MQKRIISPEDFAEKYKARITDDLKEVIANLEGVASEAEPAVRDDLKKSIAKLVNAQGTLCDVPPPCN